MYEFQYNYIKPKYQDYVAWILKMFVKKLKDKDV